MDAERIILDVDDAPAVAASARANASLEKVERTAGRVSASATAAIESESRRIISITDRSRQSIERLVAAAERKATFAGASGGDRLAAERDLLLKRVAGDEQAVNRITGAYSKLIAVEREHASGAFGAKLRDSIENPGRAAAGAIENLTSGVGKLGIIAGATLFGIGIAAKEGFTLVAEAGERAKSISNLSDILGSTNAEAEKLDAMAKIANVDIGGLTGFMRGLSKSLTEGGDEGKKGARALEELGIHARDSEGNLKGTYELLAEISRAGEKLDVREFEAKLTAMGARGAIALIPLLKNFDEVEGAAKRAGAGVNESLNHQLEVADDRLKTFGERWTILKGKLAGGLVSGFDRFTGTGRPVQSTPGVELFLSAGLATGLLGGGTGSPSQSAGTAPYDALASRMAGIAQAREDSIRRGDELVKKFEGSQDVLSLKSRLEDLDRKLKEAEAKVTPGQSVDVQQRNISAAMQMRREYERTSDQLKEIEKDESKRVANLEKIRDLTREGRQFQVIGTGPTQVINELTGLERSITNPRLAPSLRRGGEGPTLADQIRNEQTRLENETFRRKGGLLPGGTFEVGTDNLIPLGDSAKSYGAGLDQKRADDFRLRVSAVQAEAQGMERLLELRNGPGGEYETASKIASVRQSALQQEFGITGDIVRFREDSLRNEIDYRVKIGEIEKQQLDSIKGETESLLTTLFTAPSRFGRQFADTIRSAFLKPITEGIADRVAGPIRSIVFGGDGQGGVAGSIRGFFNPGSQNSPIALATNLNTQATFSNTAAILTLSAALAGGAVAGVPGGLSSSIPFGTGGGTASFASAIPGLVGSGSSLGLPSGGIFGAGSILGGPGGTPGFANSPLGGFGRLGGLLGIGKGSFTAGNLAGPLLGASVLGLGGAFKLGQKGGLLGGIGGAGLGALSGLVGMGSLTALFPSLAAAGPVGWIAAAGIGAFIGLSGMLFKSKEQQIVDRVKSVYGVEVSKQFAKTALLPIIDQQFGGSISVGIQSQQIRDLVMLYAASTNQSTSLSSTVPRSGSLVEQGGHLFQSAGSVFGKPYVLPSSLPTLGGPAAAYPTPGNGGTFLQLDGPATTALLQGQIAKTVDPGFVQNRWSDAGRSSNGRLSNSALIQQPNLITG